MAQVGLLWPKLGFLCTKYETPLCMFFQNFNSFSAIVILEMSCFLAGNSNYLRNYFCRQELKKIKYKIKEAKISEKLESFLF
jgi:hypothetical protein